MLVAVGRVSGRVGDRCTCGDTHVLQVFQCKIRVRYAKRLPLIVSVTDIEWCTIQTKE